MTDPELLKFAEDFLDGILGGKPSASWCYAVSLPLAALLASHGIPCEITEGSVAGGCHYWITLADGRCLDATADQFRKPKGSTMPKVYLGKLPAWYGAPLSGLPCGVLPKPDREHKELHALFSALAERGIAGEARNAECKLAHLCRYFDFAKPAAPDLRDIFAKVAASIRPDAEARHLVTLDRRDADVAQWVQAAVRQGLGIEVTIRTSSADWSASIHAHVAIGSLKEVARLAEKVGKQIVNAWRHFAQKPGVNASDRSMFFRGCADGLMCDERQEGQRLPARFASRGEQRRQVKANGFQISVHPYEMAVEVGRALRVDASPAKIIRLIDRRTKEALPARAA